ncbi:MAG: AAA family ATPase [Thermoplasmatota archaeon]
MNGDLKKTKLHSDERVLLFISEFSGKRELWDVPSEVTQKGISSRLGILENNVSRSLKRLSGDGLIDSELKHVKGEKRRQKAYFLSQKGEKVVSTLKERLEDLSVRVVLDGDEVKVTVPKAYRKARELGLGLTMAEIYIHRARKEMPLDLTPGWQGPGEGGNLIGNYQMPVHFYGREEEIESVEEFLHSRAGVLVIWGMAGMGKTSLVLRSMADTRGKTGYIRCEPWTDRVELVNELSWILEQMGFEKEGSELMRGDISPGQLSRILRGVANSAKGLTLIIDDLQKTGGGLDVYIEGLCKASMDSPGFKVVILTRERPSFLDPRFEIHGSLKTMELKGLDLRSVGMMIKELGKGGDIGAIWDMTKGHPLYIELVLSSMGLGARSRFGEFLDREVIAVLPPQQRNALELAVLSGLPVHRSLMARTQPEDIDILLRKGLLREGSGGLIYVHDMISDHLNLIMSGERKERLINEVLAYQLTVVLRIWADGPDLLTRDTLAGEMKVPDQVLKQLEGLFSTNTYEDKPALRAHFKQYLDITITRLLEIGSTDLALRIVSVLSRTTGKGRGKVLLGPIIKLERTRIPDTELFRLRLCKANIEVIEGDMDSAASTVDLIEATYTSSRIKGRDRATFQHIKGRISRARKEYSRTIKAHEDAIETYNKMGDRAGLAKERLHLAKALHQMGDPSRSFREAIESASDYESTMDRKGEVYACMQAYRSALVLGRDDLAAKCIERARSVSDSIGDRHLMGLVEMETMILSNRTPTRSDVQRMKDLLETVGQEESALVVKGMIKMAMMLDGPGDWETRELRAECLGMAFQGLKRSPLTRQQRSGRDHDITSQENQEMLVEILEQALSLDEALLPREKRKLQRRSSFPYTMSKDDDPRSALMEELIDAYQELSDTILVGVKESGEEPSRFDDAVEGLLHTSIRLGIHHMENGERRKAREAFRRSRRFIERYEKDLKLIPDHAPGFDLRKVKEVLEENRSLLEAMKF